MSTTGDAWPRHTRVVPGHATPMITAPGAGTRSSTARSTIASTSLPGVVEVGDFSLGI
jgi:hypothetical protein